MSDIEHMKLAEVARMLRREVRRRFPKHRLSVRCGHPAGTGGITITWEDGPTTEEVRRMVTSFEAVEGTPILLSVPGRTMPALVHFHCGAIDLSRTVTDRRVAEHITAVAHENPGLLPAEVASRIVAAVGDPQAVLDAAAGVDVPPTDLLFAGDHRLTGADLMDMGRGLPWLGRVLAQRTSYPAQ